MRRHFLASVILLTVWACPARAEESVFHDPDDHPRYGFEIEPHAIFGYGGNGLGAGTAGVGARATFLITDNGFVPSINNNVGVGFGLDFFPAHTSVVDIPLVLQWNFFLSTHFSAFGEGGLGFVYTGDPALHPVVAAGGKVYLAERFAITIRLGFPTATLGVSFLL